jgi:hypothetical protein
MDFTFHGYIHVTEDSWYFVLCPSLAHFLDTINGNYVTITLTRTHLI